MGRTEHTDCYVYLWTNKVNGKCYVGKGRGPRATDHFSQARNGRGAAFAAAIRKHGEAAFQLTYLETGLSDAAALRREVHYIGTLGTKTPAGYNISDGGDGASGAVRSPESRERYRQAKLGAANPAFGKPAHNRGKPKTAEERANISAAHRTRARDSYKGPTGRKASAEERARRKGRKASAEETARRVASFLATWSTKVVSPEEKARRSAGQRAAWARKKSSTQ